MKTFLIFISFVLAAANAKFCCEHKSIRLNTTDTCVNGKEVTIRCAADETKLVSVYRASKSSNDSALDNADQNVCIGTFKNNTRVILACEKNAEELPQENEILLDIIFVVHSISFFVSLLTSCIYFQLPSLQDVHGICAFHFSLHLALFHGLIVYETVFGMTSLKYSGLCMANVYLSGYAVLATLVWSVILSYNTWKQSRGYQVICEVRRLKNYKLIGYGLPLMVITIANLHTHLTKIYYESKLDSACLSHDTTLMVFYLSSFCVVTPLLNLYYFIESQRQLWSAYKKQTNHTMPLFRKLRIRVLLNLKLFCIMNIPFTISELSILSMLLGFAMDENWITLLVMGLPAAEGILVFLVLVAFRKRVLKGLVLHSHCFCFNILRLSEKWNNINDSETTEDNGEDGQELDDNIEQNIERIVEQEQASLQDVK